MALAPLAAPSSALADADDGGSDDRRLGAHALETLGDEYRVREGRVGDPATLAADAERAAAGTVSGTNPLLDTLPRRGAADSAAADDGIRRAKDWSEAWIADVGVLLPGALDRDGDGFFAGFELTLDVDTDASARDVYASIELTDAAGYVTLRHDTAAFSVHGYSSADRYRLEVELLSDHAAGYRDLSIDIRDAHDGQRLDRVSAYDFRSLASLPLESEQDGFVDDDPYRPGDGYHGGDRLHEGNGYVAGYAAANGPLGALPLFGFVLWRRIARRAPR